MLPRYMDPNAALQQNEVAGEVVMPTADAREWTACPPPCHTNLTAL